MLHGGGHVGIEAEATLQSMLVQPHHLGGGRWCRVVESWDGRRDLRGLSCAAFSLLDGNRRGRHPHQIGHRGPCGGRCRLDGVAEAVVGQGDGEPVDPLAGSDLFQAVNRGVAFIRPRGMKIEIDTSFHALDDGHRVQTDRDTEQEGFTGKGAQKHLVHRPRGLSVLDRSVPVWDSGQDIVRPDDPRAGPTQVRGD